MHVVSRQQNKSRPDRVAPLAVLPVFFDLTGKRVIAIGGSEAATWKFPARHDARSRASAADGCAATAKPFPASSRVGKGAVPRASPEEYGTWVMHYG